MNDTFDQVPDTERDVIRHHSRSFSLASTLLPPNVRDDVQRLYAWCRWCDESVDGAEDKQSAGERVAVLRADVQRIYRDETPLHDASKWLAQLVDRYDIPEHLPLDLLAGMQFDVDGTLIEDEEQLLLYCYRAAGTVGLMMCRLLGVTDPIALRHAAELGTAMQLTNIARDVREDWERGRRYVPATWLPMSPQADPIPTNAAVRKPVQRLLKLADQFYDGGYTGLPYLNDRSRLAIRLAGRVYQSIGAAIAQRGYRVMDGRVSLSRREILVVGLECCLSEYRYRLASWSVGRRLRSRLSTFRHTASMFQGDLQMSRDGYYLLSFALSLTMLMGAVLFVLMGINPKETVYEALPWMYAAGCVTLSGLFGLVARRINPAARPHLATAAQTTQDG